MLKYFRVFLIFIISEIIATGTYSQSYDQLIDTFQRLKSANVPLSETITLFNHGLGEHVEISNALIAKVKEEQLTDDQIKILLYYKTKSDHDLIFHSTAYFPVNPLDVTTDIITKYLSYFLIVYEYGETFDEEICLLALEHSSAQGLEETVLRTYIKAAISRNNEKILKKLLTLPHAKTLKDSDIRAILVHARPSEEEYISSYTRLNPTSNSNLNETLSLFSELEASNHRPVTLSEKAFELYYETLSEKCKSLSILKLFFDLYAEEIKTKKLIPCINNSEYY